MLDGNPDKTRASDPVRQRSSNGLNGWRQYIQPWSMLLMLMALFSACAPKPVVITPGPPPAPVPPDTMPFETGEDLFAGAEELLAEQFYTGALDKYNEYLFRFPEGTWVEKALYRTSQINLELNEIDRAAVAFTDLTQRYPDSHYIPDIGMKLLSALSSAGEHIRLIEAAAAIDEEVLSDELRLEKYLLLANAYLALEYPIDAVIVYVKAIAAASEEEKRQIGIKLKMAVTKLNTSEIRYLLNQYQDDPPGGFLLYQLGLNHIVDRQYEDAIVVLTSYLEKFPDHEIAPQARQLLAELKKTFFYERFTIGCLLPLSGRYKSYGLRALNAVTFALAQYTSNDNNPLIKIIVKDTGADPDKTSLVMDDLISQKVAAVIGPMVHAEVAAFKAQENGIPIITLTQKDRITETGDYVFRNFFTPGMQVHSLVSHVINDLGLDRFAILYPDEKYGQTYMNLFWDEVIAQEGVVVGVEAYDPKQTDFADPIKKLVGLYHKVPEYLKPPVDLIAEMLVIDSTVEDEAENNPGSARNKNIVTPKAIVDFDAVFIPDSPKAAGLVIPQLAFYDISDVYLLGTNLWHSKDLIKMAHQSVQAAIVPDGFFAQSDVKRVKAFTTGFQEIYHQSPDFIEAVSYDTAMILFQLTNLSEIRTRDELKDTLLSLKDYEGVTGLTSFKENGDVEKELYLLRIRGEKFIELKRDRTRVYR